MRKLTPMDVIHLWEIVASIGAVGVDLAAKAVDSGADPSTLIERYAAICDGPLPCRP